ncbi:hypothetical protein SDJN02_07316, partial [Cucurbita argyrosperma subsp. argyrosperma]
MASLAIRCGRNFSALDHPYANVPDGCDQKASPRSLVAFPGRFRKLRTHISSMKSLQPVKGHVKGRKKGNEAISRDKLDKWMKESVVEIVKNLREAPLFLRWYTTEDGKGARLETEKAVEEDRWRTLEEQWKNGEARTPEGIIFVQELEEEDYEGESKAWGIVVQGRCVERGAPVCYLLKTSSSRGGGGVGLWCTHFCLVRVKNFRETTKSQLKNCWLLQNQ